MRDWWRETVSTFSGEDPGPLRGPPLNRNVRQHECRGTQGILVAQPYLVRLSEIVHRLDPDASGVELKCKHFFGGAALYAGGKICASLSPAGFAVKLPEEVRTKLLRQRKGRKFRYFAGGPVKHEYSALSRSVVSDPAVLRELLAVSIKYVVESASSRK